MGQKEENDPPMEQPNLSSRLVEIESMLDRSRRRFEEGAKLVEEAHQQLSEIQQALIGSPRSVSAEDSEEAASQLLASLKASGSEMPEALCGGRLAVDQMQRLIRIDGHPIGITEMEYRVLELLAFARNNVVTRQMLLKHLYRRADDQPQPKIIDVFISKLRKKLRNASSGAEFIETIPQRGWILRDIEQPSAAA
jgi:DNA-binding response OmpR family regulator